MYYVVADVLKSTTLCVLMMLPSFWKAAAAAVWEDDWIRYEYEIRAMVLMYCATDVAQFPTVKMQPSTVAHHVCTGLFGLYIALDGPITPVCKAMLWYGLCSVLAYLVNGYKALRVVIDPTSPRMELMRTCARYMYALELLVNWPVHTMWILASFHKAATAPATALALAYVGVTYVFVADDVKLYRFLDTAPLRIPSKPPSSAPYSKEYRPPTPPRTEKTE
jgi:hypothetical protein